MRTISIESAGNLGNRMFQYLFCRMLQFQVPDSIVVGYDMEMWGLIRQNPRELPDDTLIFRGGHVFDVAAIIGHLLSGPDKSIRFGGYAQRLDYLGPYDLMRAMFPPLPQPKYVAAHDEIVISIRGGDIIEGKFHHDYSLIPISTYEQVVKAHGLKPVFVGQIGNGEYFKELRSRFHGAQFLPQSTVLEDFTILTSSVNIFLSVSTFAWMAAWLSPIADNIHIPVLGTFNPKQRPDVNLLPLRDKRYKFHDFAPRAWRGTAEDMEWAMT